jgi:hypothetical protein
MANTAFIERHRMCTHLFDLLDFFDLYNLDHARFLSSQCIRCILLLRKLLLCGRSMVLLRTRVQRHHVGANGATVLKVRYSFIFPSSCASPFFFFNTFCGDRALPFSSTTLSEYMHG